MTDGTALTSGVCGYSGGGNYDRVVGFTLGSDFADSRFDSAGMYDMHSLDFADGAEEARASYEEAACFVRAA